MDTASNAGAEQNPVRWTVGLIQRGTPPAWHQALRLTEPACSISMGVAGRPQEALGLLKWTPTGKATHTGTLCQ
jgi:hypothetical protein